MSAKSKSLLDKVATTLESRGAEYGDYQTELKRVVSIMNSFYPDLKLTESQVTRLYVTTKLVRMDRRPNPNEDDVLDLVGYLTLSAADA